MSIHRTVSKTKMPWLHECITHNEVLYSIYVTFLPRFGGEHEEQVTSQYYHMVRDSLYMESCVDWGDMQQVWYHRRYV